MAGSSSQGTFVAPRTNIPSCVLPTPCIWTKNSVLILRADSLSPSPRALHKESISSMKMIDGFFSRAKSNRFLISFSLSPCHLDTKSDEEMLKKVEFASVATALAKYDFPVPGGPYKRMPFHG